jgi:hypothetical protein
MPQFRITFFMEEGENGWTEAVHTTNFTQTNLVSDSLNYLSRRMPISAPTLKCTHVRISDDLLFRDVFLDPIALPVAGTWKPDLNTGPWTAINIRMATANPTVQRSLFLRGIPKPMITSNDYDPTPAHLAAVNNYLAGLTNRSWAIRAKDRSQVKQPITSIAADGTVVMTTGIPGLTAPTAINQPLVQLLGVKRSVSAKRLFQLNAFTDTSHFQLRGWSGGASGAVGFFRLVQYVLYPITQADTEFATERRVGRPFGVQRGRRAVVR